MRNFPRGDFLIGLKVLRTTISPRTWPLDKSILKIARITRVRFLKSTKNWSYISGKETLKKTWSLESFEIQLNHLNDLIFQYNSNSQYRLRVFSLRIDFPSASSTGKSRLNAPCPYYLCIIRHNGWRLRENQIQRKSS